MIKALFSAVAAVFNWLASDRVQKKADARDKAKAERELDADVARGREAIKTGDEAEVNRRLHRLRLALLVPITVVCLAGPGCVSASPERVVYIAEQDKAVRLDLAGRPGWWLSDDVFAQLLEAAERSNACKLEGTGK